MSTMERKLLQEFIEIYRSEPALWKMKSCYYNNKPVKNAAYRRLLVKLRELYPEADLDMVKKKINALRTNFRKEQRKVEVSRERSLQTGEPVYVPSLWYYELFHFIADQENELKAAEDNDGGIDLNNMLSVSLDENVYFEGEDSDENFDEDYQDSSPDSSKPAENGPRSSSTMMAPEHRGYKRKAEAGYDGSAWYPREDVNPYTPVTPRLDENEVFARFVALRLKRLSRPVQVQAERLIFEVVYLAQMGRLTTNSTIQTPFTKEEAGGNNQ